MTAQLLKLPEQPAENLAPGAMSARAPGVIVQLMPRARRRIIRAVVATPPFELPPAERYPKWALILIWAGVLIGCAAMWFGLWTLLRHWLGWV